MKQEMIELLVALIAFLGAVVTWYLNERSKRIYEEYQRREEKYSKLIESLKGFYISSFSKEQIDKFLTQLNLCWMYCPDEVIHKVYNFLSTVHTDRKCSDKEKERAIGELMLAIREDLISREVLKKTDLKPEDFKHLKAT